jgi:putative SOS response-associated peptidase YedK
MPQIILPASDECTFPFYGVRQNPERPVRQFSLMRWGLIPFWVKDANIGYKMINARAETVAEFGS